MFKSNKFGRIFWVDDELEFKSCPLCVDGTGDFDCEDYVSEWTDWDGVDINELLNIHKVCILNKTQYAGSLSLNDHAHKITNSDVNDPINITQFQEELEIKKYIKETENESVMNTYDEQFYKEIVKDSKFSYGKFNEINYPLHLQQQ